MNIYSMVDFHIRMHQLYGMTTPIQQVLTANRLRGGDVVYWQGGSWVGGLEASQVFSTKAEAETALTAARQFVADNVVVNPYLFDVRVEADGIYPVKEREIIRAAGPSVHCDIGKQAEGLTPESVRHAAAARDQAGDADARARAKVRDDDVSI